MTSGKIIREALAARIRTTARAVSAAMVQIMVMEASAGLTEAAGLSQATPAAKYSVQESHLPDDAEYHGGNDADEDSGGDSAEEKYREIEEDAEVFDECSRDEQLAQIVKDPGSHADADH